MTDKTHPFHFIAVQEALLSTGTREQIIRWLVWNDPKGVFTDEDSDAKSMERLTLETGREIMRKKMEFQARMEWQTVPGP